jgi:thiamine phosphate synthase YjbQ (UPF0047 family)
VQSVYATIQSTIDDVHGQMRQLEQIYSIRTLQTYTNDIQVHSQRVTRIIQVDRSINIIVSRYKKKQCYSLSSKETSAYLQTIENKQNDCHRLLEQFTQWLECKHEACSHLMSSLDNMDMTLIEIKLADIQVVFLWMT